MPIEPIVNNWQQWRGGLAEKPEVIRLLQGGCSNCSYLLKSGDQHLVLRINARDSLLQDGNRSNEAKIWQAASAAGLAPPLLYSNQQQGILVSTYITDGLPGKPEANQSVVDHALSLLERCHQLTVDVPSLDYAQHIRRYWQQIEARSKPASQPLLDQRQPMQELTESLLGAGLKSALCHHDPVIANFVGSPHRLYLIDWEYAAQGLVVMDYAALAVEWGIADAIVLARAAIEPELLAMAKTLYGYLCALWLELRPGA